jgi:hypothetical protein
VATSILTIRASSRLKNSSTNGRKQGRETPRDGTGSDSTRLACPRWANDGISDPQKISPPFDHPSTRAGPAAVISMPGVSKYNFPLRAFNNPGNLR